MQFEISQEEYDRLSNNKKNKIELANASKKKSGKVQRYTPLARNLICTCWTQNSNTGNCQNCIFFELEQVEVEGV